MTEDGGPAVAVLEEASDVALWWSRDCSLATAIATWAPAI